MTIAFIGAGNMAGSLIRGLQSSGTPAKNIIAADPAQTQLDALASLGIQTTTDNAVAVESADIVVLAIKPQITGDVLQQLPSLRRHQLVISIVAGIDMRSLQTGCQMNNLSYAACRTHRLCWVLVSPDCSPMLQ